MSAIRRTNLRQLVEEKGGPSSLAKVLGHSGPSYLSQLVMGHRPITEKTARRIEDALRLPFRYLDRLPGQALPFDGGARELVAEVAHRLADAIEASGVNVPPSKMAELLSIVYEHAAGGGALDQHYFKRLLNLLK